MVGGAVRPDCQLLSRDVVSSTWVPTDTASVGVGRVPLVRFVIVPVTVTGWPARAIAVDPSPRLIVTPVVSALGAAALAPVALTSAALTSAALPPAAAEEVRGEATAAGVIPGSSPGTTIANTLASAARTTRVTTDRVAGCGARAGFTSERAHEPLPGGSGDAAFVGKGQPFVDVVQLEPAGLDRFVVGVPLDADLAAEGFEKIVVHALVDAKSGCAEPVVDRPESREGAPDDAGFFGNFAHGRLDQRLACLDMAFGQAPFKATRAVVPGDERQPRAPAGHVDNDAACRDLLQ